MKLPHTAGYNCPKSHRTSMKSQCHIRDAFLAADVEVRGAFQETHKTMKSLAMVLTCLLKDEGRI